MIDLNITLDNSTRGQLIVQDNSIYFDEDKHYPSNVITPLKKSDTNVLVLIYLNKYQNDSELKYYSFSNTIPVTFDGWFTLYYIVLPTKEWVENNKKLIKQYYDTVYYIDGIDVVKYNPKTEHKTIIADYSELVTISESPNIMNNISITKEDGVSINYLQQCYINLCQKIFQSNRLSSCNKNNIDNDLTYKRDLVWMGINVVKYMVENTQLHEAQRIIELLHSCNGVCSDSNKTTTSRNGCNCS